MYPQCGHTILHLISRMVAPQTQQVCTGVSEAMATRVL